MEGQQNASRNAKRTKWIGKGGNVCVPKQNNKHLIRWNRWMKTLIYTEMKCRKWSRNNHYALCICHRQGPNQHSNVSKLNDWAHKRSLRMHGFHIFFLSWLNGPKRVCITPNKHLAEHVNVSIVCLNVVRYGDMPA